jgi:hypothetical protein
MPRSIEPLANCQCRFADCRKNATAASAKSAGTAQRGSGLASRPGRVSAPATAAATSGHEREEGELDRAQQGHADERRDERQPRTRERGPGRQAQRRGRAENEAEADRHSGRPGLEPRRHETPGAETVERPDGDAVLVRRVCVGWHGQEGA